jgi:hypothetical protein
MTLEEQHRIRACKSDSSKLNDWEKKFIADLYTSEIPTELTDNRKKMLSKVFRKQFPPKYKSRLLEKKK